MSSECHWGGACVLLGRSLCVIGEELMYVRRSIFECCLCMHICACMCIHVYACVCMYIHVQRPQVYVRLESIAVLVPCS